MKKNILIGVLITLLTSCEGSLKVVPLSTNASNTTYPQFNFSIRTVGGLDIIKQTQKLRYQVYLKQLDFERSDTEYTLSFQLSGTYDGNIEYDGKVYRPKDWIKIPFKSLTDNTVEIIYQPIAPAVGSYTITFTCSDPAKVSQSFSKTITVNP